LRFDFWFPKFNLNAQGLDEVGEGQGRRHSAIFMNFCVTQITANVIKIIPTF